MKWMGGRQDESRRFSILGWILLILASPIAFCAALHPPNEYKAFMGIDALDCGGPFETYMLAVPALLIYGAGLVVNERRWRRAPNAMAALVCLAICAAIAVNVSHAVAEDRLQASSCQY